jgi:hypothetical protein
MTGFTSTINSTSCKLGTMSRDFQCKPAVCSPPANVSSALPQACAEGASIGHGASCSGQCQTNLVASPMVIFCVNGNLVPPSFQCVVANPNGVPCNAPVGITNAAATACAQGATVQSKAICSSTCADGFTAVPEMLSCFNGKLDPAVFKCERRCSAPANVEGAADPSCIEGAFVMSRRVCNLQCAESRIPDPPSALCTDGALSSVTFQCKTQAVVTCEQPLPEKILRATQQPCAESGRISNDGACTGQCVTGYTPQPPTLQCRSGTLTPALFTCVEKPCPVPIGVANSLEQACLETAADTVPSGSFCTPQCKSNFVPSAQTFALLTSSRVWQPLLIASSLG